MGLLTKALATVGVLLVWFPIVATVGAAVVRSLADRIFRFDYLLPAELFPVALVGGGLLSWAALRARSRRGLVGWGLALMLGSLIGGQVLAVATGLAAGETEPAGWPWLLVLASLATYTLALVAVGIAGVCLMAETVFDSPEKATYTGLDEG